MKLLGLIAVVAVVFYMYQQRLEPGKDSVQAAMTEFEQTAPAASQTKRATVSTGAPQPATSNLRRPIDRTRKVLEQVKRRNGDGEF